MPGYMGGSPSVGTFGSLLASQDRLNNQQGFLQYNPYGYTDPSMFGPEAMQLYQQQARQMFNQNNPQAALPQNLGGALGQLASRAIMGQPQQQGGPPPQGSTGMDPITQMILAQRTQYMQGGMSMGEAQARAAEDLMSNQQIANSPAASQIAQRAYQEAVDKLHYDPKLAQEKSYQTENFINPNTHQVSSFNVGSTGWRQATNSGWPKAGDETTPQVGERKQFTEGGLIVSRQWDGQGWKKEGQGSSQPVQYGVTATGSPSQVAGAFPNAPKVFSNAGAEEVTKDLTNRSIAAKNAIDGIDHVTELLNQDPNTIGKAGDVLEKINNWRSEVGNLASAAGFNDGDIPMSAAFAKASAPYIDRFRKAGIDATKWNGMMTDLAYTVEAAQGNTNTDPSSRASRIEQIKEDILGDRSSDSEAVKATLGQKRQSLIANLNNEFEGKPNVMSKPKWLQDELSKVNSTSSVGPYADPEKERRYQEWKRTHNAGS
jgi:hypothetical protein